MKVREIEKLLKKAGWYVVTQKGSHRHYEHDVHSGKVTVSQHSSDIPIGTAKAILKQAKIEVKK